MRRIRERPHRLPEGAYIGKKSVSFTACELHRRPLFANEGLVSAFVPLLHEAVTYHKCVVPIYLFMPDHLHVVVTGTEDWSLPKIAMERFKETSGNWLKEQRTDLHWQKDFHDRIVRKSEDWAAHLRYIALNPVRAGLAHDVTQWPFKGSIGMHLDEVLRDAFW